MPPSDLAGLREVLNQKAKLDLEAEYERLLTLGGGSATGAMLQSDINRGVLPGAATPGMEDLPPEDLAQIDRFAWGRQAGMGGLPVAAGYEALKALSQRPEFSDLLPFIADALGFENTGEQFDANAPTSSPASFQNVGAYIQGAMPRMLRSSLASRGR